MIELQHVTKFYPIDTGLRYILRDVSLVIPSRTNMAVIGPNGAGKSTFLRLVGGAEGANKGTIISDSEVSWPLGLTSGFQGSLTGRQNVLFVCRINGLDMSQSRDVIGQIIDFAELGEYFDMPVNTYSSGMRARLSFGLSMSFDFDVYLIDELTSVGDTIFREKAKAAFEKIRKRASLIYASHNLGSIRQSCQTALFLREGLADFYPNIEDGIEAYTQYIKEHRNHGMTKEGRALRLKKRIDENGNEVVEDDDEGYEYDDEKTARKAAKKADKKAAKQAAKEAEANSEEKAAEKAAKQAEKKAAKAAEKKAAKASDPAAEEKAAEKAAKQIAKQAEKKAAKQTATQTDVETHAPADMEAVKPIDGNADEIKTNTTDPMNANNTDETTAKADAEKAARNAAKKAAKREARRAAKNAAAAVPGAVAGAPAVDAEKAARRAARKAARAAAGTAAGVTDEQAARKAARKAARQAAKNAGGDAAGDLAGKAAKRAAKKAARKAAELAAGTAAPEPPSQTHTH